MKYFNKITGFAIVAVLVLSPAFAMARNSNSDKSAKEAKKELREELKEKKKENKEEVKQLKQELKQELGSAELCGKYFNRFFTYGWMKWGPFWSDDSSVDVDDFEEWVREGCNPRPRTASSTDVTAPVISDVSSMALKTIALVSWNTNENADGTLYYSTSSPVNTSTASKVHKGALTKDHWMLVFGLTPNTTYYAVVTSKDKAGNTATSNQFSWNTSGTIVVPPADTTAPVISSISTTAGTSTASVSWQTNEVSTSKVYYSTTTPFNIASSTTLQVSNSTLVTSHVVPLSGLATGTPYYVSVESRDSAGNVATSSQFSFTTSGI